MKTEIERIDEIKNKISISRSVIGRKKSDERLREKHWRILDGLWKEYESIISHDEQVTF